MKAPAELKIFLVDEDTFCLFMYQRHLNNLGFTNVRTFQSATDFLANLADAPDVIFMDHEIASINDMELHKVIKRFLKNVHTIFVAGKEDAETVIRSLQQGAYECIFKGEYDLEKITGVMNRIMESKELNSKKRSLLDRLLCLAV